MQIVSIDVLIDLMGIGPIFVFPHLDRRDTYPVQLKSNPLVQLPNRKMYVSIIAKNDRDNVSNRGNFLKVKQIYLLQKI